LHSDRIKRAPGAVAPRTDVAPQTAVVTGGTSGIGYEVCLQLATHGARVFLTGRDASRVAESAARLRAARPTCQVEALVLDVGSFKSVDAFVKELRSKVKTLHVLINNAGVFAPPHAKTPEGFETQLGVNYVGPAYLTLRLLPLLKAAQKEGGARVVMLSSSMAGTAAKLSLDDLGGEALTESSHSTYGLSKLYDALFALELEARHKAGGVSAFAVHPGFVDTGILGKADASNWLTGLLKVLVGLMAVPTSDGALSTLYAATAAPLADGRCLGPNEANVGFTRPWAPRTAAYTAENATALYEATLKLIAAKGGVLEKS